MEIEPAFGLFCFVLFCFVLFCFVLFCFVLFCFVLFCFVLFCVVLFTYCCGPVTHKLQSSSHPIVLASCLSPHATTIVELM